MEGAAALYDLSDNFHQRHFLSSFVKLQCAARLKSINRRFLRQESRPRHRRVPLRYRGFVKF